MEKLIAKAMKQNAEQLAVCAHLLKDAQPGTPEHMSRVAILSAYESKTSGEAVDALMDEIGL